MLGTFGFPILLTLLSWRQKGLRRRQEFDPWKLGDDVDALESPFLSAAAIEGQKILVAKVHANLIQVRFESDGRSRAERVGFGARLV
jgi:hypothetical protein